MSSDGRDLVYAVIGFGAGIYNFYKGFRTFREYRVVEDTPEMPIRSIAMGLVRVHGKAQGSDLVPSPLTHTSCFFYKVEIEKWKSDRNHSGYVKYRTDTDGVKFYLQDASGKSLVDAQDAEFDLLQSCRHEIVDGGMMGRVLPAFLTSNLSGKGKGPALEIGGASEAELRGYISSVTTKKISSFIEKRLNPERPGVAVAQEKSRQAALGMFQHPVGSAEFLDHALAAQGPGLPQHLVDMGPQSASQKEQARLEMIEAYKHPYGSAEFRAHMQRAIGAPGAPPAPAGGLSGSAESLAPTQRAIGVQGGPGGPAGGLLGAGAYAFYPQASGRYRLTEFLILPDHWYDVTGTCVENPRPQDEHDRNLIMKGHNEPTFLISFRAAGEVGRPLRRRAAGQIFGGAALSIGCLAYLLFRFHMF